MRSNCPLHAQPSRKRRAGILQLAKPQNRQWGHTTYVKLELWATL